MFCPKCGKRIREGASYCTECGGKLMCGAAARIKQPNRGKRLTAAVSLLTIAAAIIVFFIFFSGTPVEGQWYSEYEFSVLEFKSGQAQLISLSGTRNSEYEYSREKGEGAITLEGKACAFSAEKDELTLQSPEGDIKFTRAKEAMDAEDFIREGLPGIWSNEELAQVIELKEDGRFTVYSAEGEEASVYDYDIGSGEGSLTKSGEKSVFTAKTKELNIKGSGIYIRQQSGFDIAAFIEKFGNPLKGVWYDASGIMGKFHFQDSGILFVTSYGIEYQGVYTFSNTKGKGTLFFGGKTMDVIYSGGALKIRGQAFTKGYTAQKDKSDVYEQLKGKWYDKQGNGSVEFSADGTAVFERDGNTLNASCTFDPIDGAGKLTLCNGSDVKVLNILISSGMLAAGEWLYIRNAPEQTNTIAGIWYDSDGRVGTLTLKTDGKAELIFSGSVYSGAYSWDEVPGKGTITAVYNGQTWTFDMELKEGLLVVRTGILFYNEITFTRENIQPAAPPTP